MTLLIENLDTYELYREDPFDFDLKDLVEEQLRELSKLFIDQAMGTKKELEINLAAKNPDVDYWQDDLNNESKTFLKLKKEFDRRKIEDSVYKNDTLIDALNELNGKKY